MGLKAADVVRHWITSRQLPIRIPPPDRLWISATLILAMMTTAVVASAKPVTLVVRGQPKAIRTYARTVGDLLAEAGIRLGGLDRVMPAADSPVCRGEVIRVSTVVPVVLRLWGREVLDRSTASETVAGVLKENGIELGPGDQVQPGLTTQVASGMEITVDRLTIGTRTKNVPLPFSTRQISSPDLFRGIDRIIRPGRPGVARQVWQVAFLDGVPTGETLVRSDTVTPPQDQVVEVGTLGEVSRGGNVIRFTRVIEARATAYTGGGSTATGTVARPGTVAVDPAVIPLGSRVYVEGYGYGTALDTGGAIRGHRVDLYFDTAREVDQWGVRYVKVFVLD